MERIVNGHYADPESTRDIVGLTPFQFETIISGLQFFHKSLEMLLSSTPEMRKAFLMSDVSKDMIGVDEVDFEAQEKHLIEREEIYVQQYHETYEILKAINQPYPGAEY